MTTVTKQGKGVLVLKAIATRTVFLLITAILMFLSAGTLAWNNAWLYLSLFYFVMLLIVFVNLVSNPENLKLHDQSQHNKQDDRWLLFAYNIMLFLFPAAAGILHRANYDLLPAWSLYLGLVLLSIGVWLALASIWVNRYFETEIKVQGDDHQVVTGGPYKIIRHPGYISSIIMWIASPLILQSSFLFVFSSLFTLFFIARTDIEDKYLQKELKGYSFYAKTVKYRLIPGVW